VTALAARDCTQECGKGGGKVVAAAAAPAAAHHHRRGDACPPNQPQEVAAIEPRGNATAPCRRCCRALAALRTQDTEKGWESWVRHPSLDRQMARRRSQANARGRVAA
jgi:hypothetical protein